MRPDPCKSINGIGRALNIIENYSNMAAAVAPVRLGAATPGEYAVIMEQHMMPATVTEDGIKLFDSSKSVTIAIEVPQRDRF